MQSLIQLIREQFNHAVRSVFPELSGEEQVEIAPSTQLQFGDYQCNSAMKYAKILGKNPRSIAQSLLENIPISSNSIIGKLEVAGPGFINIWVNPSFAADCLNKLLIDDRLGFSLQKDPQKIIVEFSSPNTAKELHVGHLRSTIIGDSLARLFEFLGHHVLRLNHVGDWGTQFGMLIAYIKDAAPEVFHGHKQTDLTSLVTWYKAAKQRFDQDSDFKKRAQLEVVALQSGAEESIRAWETICAISRKAYQEIYELLDIRITERGESYYNPVLPEIVKELEEKGLVTISDGAKCIFLEGFKNREGDPLPLMIQKSDGGYNYDTTDMAAIRQRILEEKASRLIYVTDAGQSTHFHMIFQAAQKAGYLNPPPVELNHVPFGVVLGQDGKKFKTRSGETERLIDLLTTAVKQAKDILIEKKPEMAQMSPQEVDHIAQILGINAIKYADLSCLRTGDYTFSYERMLRFEGNTAAFLMYAYVRVAGIKRKIGGDTSALQESESIALSHPAELALGIHLLRFHETLDVMARDLLPNRLSDYLFNLAEKFHAFFRDCRVEGTPEQNQRLLLCELVASTLKQGMEILGLKTVERM